MARNPHTNKKKIRIHRGGRPMFLPTEEQRELVARLRAEGMTVANIAKRIGVHANTLVRVCRAEIGETQPGKKLHIEAMISGDVDAAIRWLERYGNGADPQRRIELFTRLAPAPPSRT
jgi:hypothetical protein